MNRILVRSIYGQSSVKIAHFVPICEMRNLYREHSIDASYQVSVHLAKRFRRRKFLEIDQLETRIDCGSHMIRNSVGSIYGQSSIKIDHSVPIHSQT
jgi:hypothetical protein